MNNESKPKDNTLSDDYTWNGVIEFQINQCRKAQLKETESLLEKKEMEEKISEQTTNLKSQEGLNEELMKRVKMLEYCIRQERLKFSAALSKSSPQEKKEILREQERLSEATQGENSLGVLEKLKENDIELPKRRAIRHKEYQKKILKEFDCTDILEDVFDEKLDEDPNNDSKFDKLDSIGTNLVKSYDHFETVQQRAQGGVSNIETLENKATNPESMGNNNIGGNQDHANIFNLNDNRNSGSSDSNQYTSFGGTNQNTVNNNNSLINKNDQAQKNGSLIQGYGNDTNNGNNEPKNVQGIIPDATSNNNASPIAQKQNLQLRQCINWRAHLDSVRSLAFNPENNLLQSVGDDCLTRLAVLNSSIVENVINYNHNIGKDFNYGSEPLSQETLVKNSSYLNQDNTETIREDIFPIQCICQENGVVANASVDGLIRQYTLKNLMDSQNQNDVFNRGYINDFRSEIVLEAHDDAIWSIALHSTENLLQSCSADQKLKYNKFVKMNDRVLRHRDNGSSYDTMKNTCTSQVWSEKIPSQFYAATNKGSILMYDLNVQSPINTLNYQGLQVNKLKSSFDKALLYGACDDGIIRIFDSDSNKVVNTFKGHTDSVSSISLSNNGFNFVSAGHDSKLILWDVRQTKQICQLENTHWKKYDEVIFDCLYVDSLNFVVTAGTDGDVNFYQMV